MKIKKKKKKKVKNKIKKLIKKNKIKWNNYNLAIVTYLFIFNFNGEIYQIEHIAHIDKTLKLDSQDFLEDYIRDIEMDLSFFFNKDINHILNKNNIVIKNSKEVLNFLEDIKIIKCELSN